MNEQRKKRLVGFLVIISVAVIALPLLLDGQGYKERQALEVTIPPAPEPLDFVAYTPKNKSLESTTELAPARGEEGSISREAAVSKAIDYSEAKKVILDREIQDTTSSTKEKISKEQVAKAENKAAKKVSSSQSNATSKQQMILTTDKPVLDKQGIPVAWTLQLASFKGAANAAALRKKLRDKGYKAYIRRKGDLNKVFVGPDIQRSEIEKLKSQLQRELKLNGLILRFATS